jgi:hypothetical protein
MLVSGTRLVDANVWLALAFSDHAHHHVAVSWFEGLGEKEAAFCRITQMALAAFAISAHLPLSTLDRGFKQFGGLTLDFPDEYKR